MLGEHMKHFRSGVCVASAPQQLAAATVSPILPGPSPPCALRPLRLFLPEYPELPVPSVLSRPCLRFPRKVKGDLSPQHVYIEDGTHQTREAAFKHYHFTMFCADFSLSPFPPLALVYSLAYVAHVPWQGFWMLFAFVLA